MTQKPKTINEDLPNHSPHGGVHALGVTPAGEDSDDLASMRVRLDFALLRTLKGFGQNSKCQLRIGNLSNVNKVITPHI